MRELCLTLIGTRIKRILSFVSCLQRIYHYPEQFVTSFLTEREKVAAFAEVVSFELIWCVKICLTHPHLEIVWIQMVSFPLPFNRSLVLLSYSGQIATIGKIVLCSWYLAFTMAHLIKNNCVKLFFGACLDIWLDCVSFVYKFKSIKTAGSRSYWFLRELFLRLESVNWISYKHLGLLFSAREVDLPSSLSPTNRFRTTLREYFNCNGV